MTFCDHAPAPYEWPSGFIAAATVSVDFDGPSPYLWASRGSAIPVLGELEQRRFGPRQGIWRVLAMLDRLQLPATFYVPGAMVDAHPPAVKSIISAGHEVGLHGYMHERLDDLTTRETATVLDRSMQILAAAGGREPFGYRSPSWEMTPETWVQLREAGIRYDSSLMGYDHPYWLDGLVEVPVQWQLDDAIFYRYVNGAARPPAPATAVMDDWAREIAAATRFSGLAMMTIHPWLSGRAGRLVAFEEMLRDSLEIAGVWWATAGQIADHHRAHHSSEPSDALRPGEL